MSIATDHRNSECVWMEFLDICRSALAAESNSPKCLPVMSPLTCMSTLGARNPRITGPRRVVGMCRFFVLAASIKEKKLDSQIRQRGSAIHICFCGVLTSLWWGLCTGWGGWALQDSEDSSINLSPKKLLFFRYCAEYVQA